MILTIGAATISTKIKLKWPVIFFASLPPIAGAAALYTLGRGAQLRAQLLGCYYVVCGIDNDTLPRLIREQLSFFTALRE